MFSINPGQTVSLSIIYKEDVCLALQGRAALNGGDKESIVVHFGDNEIELRDSLGNLFPLPNYRFVLIADKYGYLGSGTKAYLTDMLDTGRAILPLVHDIPAQCYSWGSCGLVAPDDYVRSWLPRLQADGCCLFDREGAMSKCERHIKKCDFVLE